MQIKNTEYWDFIPTAVSSILYDQVKSDLSSIAKPQIHERLQNDEILNMKF